MDEAQFVAMYGALRPDIERYLRRSLDAAAASDVTDETFARAWQARHSYDPDRGALQAWIYGIARNVRASHLRATMNPSVCIDRLTTESHETAAVDRIDAVVAAGVIGVALAGLTASEVEAIAPVIVACLGGMEVARRTNAEHVRLHRIRRKLREVLARSSAPRPPRSERDRDEDGDAPERSRSARAVAAEMATLAGDGESWEAYLRDAEATSVADGIA